MKSGLFIANNGTFGDEFLVSFCLTKEEVSKKLKKEKGVVKGISEWVLTCPETSNRDKGFVYNHDEKNLCWLSLPHWDGSWDQHEVLLHECVHLMQFYKQRKMISCSETEAYLVEYLFRQIRQRLPQKK